MIKYVWFFKGFLAGALLVVMDCVFRIIAEGIYGY